MPKKGILPKYPKSLLMLLSLPLLETIKTISFNHNTTGLVTFSNVWLAPFLDKVHTEVIYPSLKDHNCSKKFKSIQSISKTTSHEITPNLHKYLTKVPR